MDVAASTANSPTTSHQLHSPAINSSLTSFLTTSAALSTRFVLPPPPLPPAANDALSQLQILTTLPFDLCTALSTRQGPTTMVRTCGPLLGGAVEVDWMDEEEREVGVVVRVYEEDSAD